jgi:hypothetical protein
MAKNNFAKLLKDAKDLGRFEGFMAYMECAVVALHNLCADHEIDEEIENKLIGNLDAEINRILHLNQHMTAEDIGAAVVQYAEKKRLEVARGEDRTG